MKTICPNKIASRMAMGLALIALLLTSSVTLRADDKQKKNSAPARSSSSSGSSSKPAPARSSSSGSSSNSSNGGNKGSHWVNNGGGARTNNTTRSVQPADNGQNGGHHGHHNDSSSSSGTVRTDNVSRPSGGTVRSDSTINNDRHNHRDRDTINTPGTIHNDTHRSDIRTDQAHRADVIRARPGRTEVVHVRGGDATVRRSFDGRVHEVHARDMTIIRGPGVSRRVVVVRPDRSRIVVNHFGYGYVQRPFVYRNYPYATRTYFYNGRPYALYYRGYNYRGLALNGYVPYRYYSPAFYGWAYHPWARPVYYSWGWAASPWYNHYNYYFSPYSSYPSASFWLTDFLISSSLQAAYLDQYNNQPVYGPSSFSGPVGLSDDVKQEISDEVSRQLALENSERQSAIDGSNFDIESSGLPRMLAEASPSNPRIFVVANTLNVTDQQGQDCTLTEGDVLRLTNPPDSGANSAYLQVLAGKHQSCVKGSTVEVDLADLQEMQNHMRASIDRGLQDLQTHQGGLPTPPPAATVAPTKSAFAPIAPPADPNVSSELKQQAQEANSVDQQVQDDVQQVRPPNQ